MLSDRIGTMPFEADGPRKSNKSSSQVQSAQIPGAARLSGTTVRPEGYFPPLTIVDRASAFGGDISLNAKSSPKMAGIFIIYFQ